MRRKAEEEVVECPYIRPEEEVYVIETGIPVEMPVPYEPAVPEPYEPAIPEPKKANHA